MERNNIAKYGAIVLFVIAVLVGIKNCGGGSKTTEQALSVSGGEPISDAMAEKLRIEGDTEGDTVRTLIGEVKSAREEIDQLMGDNRAQRKENRDLRSMESRLEKNLQAEVVAQREVIEQAYQQQLAASERKLRALETRLDKQSKQSRRPPQSAALDTGGQSAQGVVWIGPLGSQSSAAAESGTADSGLFSRLDSARSGLKDKLGIASVSGGSAGGKGGKAALQAVEPHYTIPKNATLINATAMTALVGRVPLNARVTDPYNFKVIIGRDNLAANGIELPEVSYSIASGKAVGDWTLGCVRGDLTSITFVFEDGTIRTVPEPRDVYEGGGSTREVVIGELSDELGNPCVVGQRITNAYNYLAQRIGVVGASAAAEAAAASQTTQVTSIGGGGTGVTSIVDGSTGKYVLGRTIADGSAEVAQWLDERQAQQFDAIYVKPGANVSMHITAQLEIDYDPQGRKTNHMAFSQGGHRALD